MWPKRKTPLERKNAALDAQLAEHKLKSAVEAKERLVLELSERERYRSGDPATRSRIDASARHDLRGGSSSRPALLRMSWPDSTIRRGWPFAPRPPSAIGRKLLPARSRPASVSRSPRTSASCRSGYDYLTTAFKSLYQVQGLIREMYPYKSTIIRYIQTLDFAPLGVPRPL